MQQIEMIQQNKMMQQNKVIIGTFSLLFTLLVLIGLFWVGSCFIADFEGSSNLTFERMESFTQNIQGFPGSEDAKKVVSSEPGILFEVPISYFKFL